MVLGTHLGPMTNLFYSFFNYFRTVTDLVMWGALSDEKSGLYVSDFFCWTSPGQPFSVLSLAGLMSIFH
jgi:hypothetical protein